MKFRALALAGAMLAVAAPAAVSAQSYNASQVKKSVTVGDLKAIVQELGNPILSASLPGENVADYTDPEVMEGQFGKLVDLVIDGGIGGIVPSTVINFTEPAPEVIRMGAGEWG